MTTAQRITLMADWWPAACRAQGWKQSDRAKRMEVLSAAVRRPLASASELNSTDDVDAVKAHLGMLADNLDATKETDHPELGRARRLRATITGQMKCLALYIEGADAYLAEIIKDKFKHGSRAMPLTVADLTAEPRHFTDQRTGKPREIPSQLDQVIMTLARAVQKYRTEAGHSLHTMKKAAGLECHCTICAPRRRVVMVMAASEPEPVASENPF